MGDVSDMSDLKRFMRSKEGQAHLREIRHALIGRRVIAVEFAEGIQSIGLELNLDDGTMFECQRPDLDVDALREDFVEVIDREYYKDYPERAPRQNKT